MQRSGSRHPAHHKTIAIWASLSHKSPPFLPHTTPLTVRSKRSTERSIGFAENWWPENPGSTPSTIGLGHFCVQSQGHSQPPLRAIVDIYLQLVLSRRPRACAPQSCPPRPVSLWPAALWRRLSARDSDRQNSGVLSPRADWSVPMTCRGWLRPQEPASSGRSPRPPTLRRLCERSSPSPCASGSSSDSTRAVIGRSSHVPICPASDSGGAVAELPGQTASRLDSFELGTLSIAYYGILSATFPTTHWKTLPLSKNQTPHSPHSVVSSPV